MKRIAIQSQDFDIAAELAALEALGGGGVASFTGVVRAAAGSSRSNSNIIRR